MVIDLHGYSMPIARAAVRSALYMLQKEAVSEGALLESSDRIEDIDSDVEDSSSSGSGSGSSRIVVNTPATSASASASASVIADSKVPSKGMGTLIFPDSPPKKDPAPVSSSNRLTPRGRRSLVIITGM